MKFSCPRCEEEATQELYGPCDACISELRSTIRAEARPVESEDYVPKMNVTPNAVASKDG